MQPIDGPAIHVSKCVYVDGRHHPGPDCPHSAPKDEEGDIKPLGWTCQQ